MNTARVKRHSKLLLHHPLELSKIPVVIAVVAITYMFTLTVFAIGFKGGVSLDSSYTVNKIPAPVNVYYGPAKSAPVYNLDTNTTMPADESDEMLKMDETDTQLKKEMDDLLMNMDNSKVQAYQTDSVVLGASDTDEMPTTRAVPVEKRMYNDKTLLKQTESDINVITPESNDTFNLKNIILPVIALGFAVLGVNYMEHRAMERKKISKHVRKASK